MRLELAEILRAKLGIGALTGGVALLVSLIFFEPPPQTALSGSATVGSSQRCTMLNAIPSHSERS